MAKLSIRHHQKDVCARQPTCWPSQLRNMTSRPSCCNHAMARHAHAGWSNRNVGMLLAAATGSSNSTAHASSSQAAAAAAATAAALITCKRCKQLFSTGDNTRDACRYHPSLYSGGEVAKAIGFVRASDAPEDQLERVVGRRGLMRFWDCCGNEDENAPGCCVGFHITFDDEFNEARGWH